MENKLYRVVLTQDEEGGYVADVPTLQHCISYGATLEEAMQNIQEVLQGMLELMEEYGDEIPDDKEKIEYSLTMPIHRQQPALVA